MAVLRNEFISIEVKNLGAELISLKKTGDDFEYIWSGRPEFWTGQSPVLFPIVGFLNNGSTIINGEEYRFANHGFARRHEFETVCADTEKLIFALRSNASTLKLYPFQFELRLIYTLDKNSVKISYEVENLSDEDIYFQLGTHPGFNCPMVAGTNLSDYFLEFSEAETARRYFINGEGLIDLQRTELLLNNTRTLPLSHELFHDGALILKELKSNSVVLKTANHHRYVRLDWKNFPYLGIWQPKDAPFVCIEPWHGITETENCPVEFKDKEKIVCLPEHEVFCAEINIEV